jgi:uncharacterized membrane protein YraQ (UPF0718 family)
MLLGTFKAKFVMYLMGYITILVVILTLFIK